MLSTLDKFKEGISNEIFSIIDLKIKKNFYDLTSFRVQDFLSLFFFSFFFFFFFFFFFAAEEADLMILVHLAAEFLLTIVIMQEKLTVPLL